MKLSVSILAWNTLKTLKMTFEILKEELNGIDHEYIIVDNGSRDGTQDFIIKSNFRNMTYAFNPENVGISKGKNQGFRMSKGEYVLLLDGDVVPVPNSIIKMIEFLDTNEDKHAIGFYPNKFAIEPNRYGMSHHEGFCDRLFDPKPSPTACLFYGMYRKWVLDKCLMDETGEFGKPGYGWEDHDFFETMKAAGITQWVAHMNHAGGKYYHAINSSLRPECLGHEEYRASSVRRSEQFNRKWKSCPAPLL